MTEQQGGMGRVASALMVLTLLAVTTIAVTCLRLLGDYQHHEFGLHLTERILWGVWILVAVVTFLTHVTIFGWSFRRYFRYDKEASPAVPPPPRRPTTAPWFKSPVASFSITIVLVSLLGVAATATAVLWILEDLIGRWVFWLVCMILWNTWWVLSIATVLTRITLFGLQKKSVIQATQQANPRPNPTEPTSEAQT